MSEARERIWAFHGGPMVGYFVGKSPGPGAFVSEYIRADLAHSREAVEALSAEARENLLDEIEEIINETHDIDVNDRNYAENIVGWLERHHPTALRALGLTWGDTQ